MSLTDPYRDIWVILACDEDWKKYGYHIYGVFQAKEPIDIANYLINTEAGQHWIFSNLFNCDFVPMLSLSPLEDNNILIETSNMGGWGYPTGNHVEIRIPRPNYDHLQGLGYIKGGGPTLNTITPYGVILDKDQLKMIILESYRKDPQRLLDDLGPTNDHYRIVNAWKDQLFLEAMYDGYVSNEGFSSLETIIGSYPAQVITSPSA